MRFSSFLVGSILALSIFSANPSTAQELDSWEMGINYPGEDSTNAFLLSEDGSVEVGFFVENSGLTEITVEFSYEVPFSGNHEGTESETIPSGSNETFELVISEVDVFSFEAGKTEKVTISATVTARQGVPDPLGSSQSREGDLEIPVIYDLSVDISDPFGPMNSGTDTILTVVVENNGNSEDGIGEIEVDDDCPLLTTDNGLDSLLVGNIGLGKSKDAELRISASESHPRRNCDVTVTVHSKMAMNQGKSVYSTDEARISVEPPPSGSLPSDGEEESESVEDSIQSNLPASGFMFVGYSFFLAIVFPKSKRHD
ncbi:MAG: hypothetical protein CMB67_03450 [Euryarchaeota archaeon]|nr:hypothetical protein [Euryarchaeota archaeon]